MLLPTALLLSATTYWIALIIAAVLLVIVGMSLFILRAKQASKMQEQLQALSDGLDELGSSDMEHLTTLDRLIENSTLVELKKAYSSWVKHSKQQYKDEYLAEASLLKASLQNESFYSSQFAPTNVIPSILGLVLTVALIAFQNFLTGSDALMLSASLFPLFLGLLLHYLIHSSTSEDRKRLDFSIDTFIAEIKLKLPVYNPEASSALLISRFVSYNEQLSQSAKDLLASEVITGVESSLNESISRDIVPSLTRSSEDISQLANRLSTQQENGIDELKGLSQEVLSALRDFQTERSSWDQERQMANESFKNLSEAANRLTDTQTSLSDVLGERITSLEEALNNHASNNKNALEQLVQIQSQLEKQLADEHQQSIDVLQDYHLLSTEIRQAAKQIELSNQDLSKNIAGLNNAIDNSISGYKEQLQSQVNHTLDDFDRGLAEMSLRLSHSATEVRDTANFISRQQDQVKHKGDLA